MIPSLPPGELLRAPLFSWMPEADCAMLANCFDLETERLAPGEARESRGRLGYLLSGRGRLRRGDAEAPAAAGTVWGLDGDGAPAEETLTAEETCLLVWLDGDVMTSVCYRACWFHGRFVTEVRRRLGEPRTAE